MDELKALVLFKRGNALDDALSGRDADADVDHDLDADATGDDADGLDAEDDGKTEPEGLCDTEDADDVLKVDDEEWVLSAEDTADEDDESEAGNRSSDGMELEFDKPEIAKN